ncbi:hypothetical protein [Streptomyces sp. NBC_00005]|uniref:hypothetical protein n=1 Tax=Streptomyces sp. NBC_00005 TaxID=2903609 RepID=UPI00324800A8
MMRFLRWFRHQDTGVKAALIGLVGTLTAALITATVTLTVALNRPSGGGGASSPPTSALTTPASDTPPPGPTTTAPQPGPTEPSTTPPPSPSKSTPPPTSKAPPAPQSRVRWHGNLVLDGDTMTRGWWLDQVPPGSAVNGDVYTEGSSALYSDAALVAWSGSGAPTHDECAALLNANPGQHVLDVQVGDLACVGTWDKRVGYVEVTAVPDAQRIRVSATVWESE